MKIHSFRHRILRQRRFRQILISALIFSSLIGVIIVPIERMNKNATIQTFGDGMWWTVQTVTTVGYGDVTPVTNIGRFLGIILQILGTLMFGTVIALISTNMGRNQEELYWNRLFDRLDILSDKVEKIERKTSFLVTYDAEHDAEYKSSKASEK